MGCEITTDERGEITEYQLTDIQMGIKDSDEFFETIIQTAPKDEFLLKTNGTTEDGLIYEQYIQYYENVPVHKGMFTLYRQQDKIVSATGNYFRVGLMDASTKIDAADAVDKWCNLIDKPVPDQQDIRIHSLVMVPDVLDNIILSTKPLNPVLVYRIYLRDQRPGNSIIGYLEASTGNLMMTESIYIF